MNSPRTLEESLEETNTSLMEFSLRYFLKGEVKSPLKYLSQYCRDTQFGNGKWLYGGDKESDEKASKAAAHELVFSSSLFTPRFDQTNNRNHHK